MKAIMCSVHDITTSTFRAPFYAMNEEDAKRAFRMILNSNDLMKQNPSDFELYHVGLWDDETGIYDLDQSGKVSPCQTYRMYKGGEIIHEPAGENTI